MSDFYYCGFKSHLRFKENCDKSSEKNEFILPLNNLLIESKYGNITKAYLGWCSLFILTNTGTLLNFHFDGIKSSFIECFLNSWDIKHLECGSKETYIIDSNKKAKKWRSLEYTIEPEIITRIHDETNVAKVEEISVGSSFFCALLENGEVKGIDDEGVPISFKGNFISISCGHEHILFLTDTGKVFSYGKGSRGQLGHENLDDIFDEPKIIEALNGIKIMQISAGGWNSLALSEFGDIYSWGWNESGQLGIGVKEAIITIPTLINIESVNFIYISSGSRHSLAVSLDGHLYGWGWNKYGQLGLDSETIKSIETPTKVPFKHKCISVKCKFWSSIIEAVRE